MGLTNKLTNIPLILHSPDSSCMRALRKINESCNNSMFLQLFGGSVTSFASILVVVGVGKVELGDLESALVALGGRQRHASVDLNVGLDDPLVLTPHKL